ncbi:hypothetical protein ACJMK2_011472 [Sinanodonta woodiana]|uniref:BRCA1-associated protein n=1 Tax=Sinanodonta woodiana TaxID=1069815 RepID=A0ABD3V534_SINWO
MSVALLVIRLEINDKSEIPKSISYTALGFNLEEKSKAYKSPKPSYAAVAISGLTPVDDIGDVQSEEGVDYKGRRRFQEITIETYIGQDFKEKPAISSDSANMASANSEINESKFREFHGDASMRHNKSREGSQGSFSKDQKEFEFKPISAQDSMCQSESLGSRSSSIRSKSQSPMLQVMSTIYFYSGNPLVEKTEGILHIYKENQMTSLAEDARRSELICLLAVPAVYTLHDLLKFTAPVAPSIEYLKIIRDSTPNQYMVLIKFISQKFADEFFNNYNNTYYNSIENDVCHMVYIAKVEILKESEGASLPVPGLTELPNCPVCLERMEESVDGILTILCNHAFHMKCLAQWGDTSCPVCRHVQTPEEVADNRCMKCGSPESLWMCLICGHIGCGRYVGMHAYRHFQKTQHTYAMELGNNKVWDYVGENYVHRLVQNKSDGKIIQVDESGHPVEQEKLDSLTLEYTYLLTNQLESQRLYFEEKMNLVEKEAHNKVTELETQMLKCTKECQQLKGTVRDLMQEKQQTEKKYNHIHGRLKKALQDLQEEREMNKCLLDNQHVWQKKVATLEVQIKEFNEKKDQEIQDLKEQLRDVMFFVEAQQKLANTSDVSQEEIQEGQIIVGAASPNPAASGRRSRKKNR